MLGYSAATFINYTFACFLIMDALIIIEQKIVTKNAGKKEWL